MSKLLQIVHECNLVEETFTHWLRLLAKSFIQNTHVCNTILGHFDLSGHVWNYYFMTALLEEKHLTCFMTC